MTRARRRGRARSASATRSTTPGRRGGGGHRQDDRAGAPHRRRAAPGRAARSTAIVARDVHREGGGRAEAAPARGARRSARARPPAQPRARAASSTRIARLEEARVSTIHGFCADLLRERPVEARVDPQFEVLDRGARPSASSTRPSRAGSHEQLEDPPEGVRRALRRRCDATAMRRRSDRAAARRRLEAGRLARFPGAWRREPFDRDAAHRRAASARVHALRRAHRHCATRARPLYRDPWPLRAAEPTTSARRARARRDHDGCEAALVDLRRTTDFAPAAPGQPRRSTRGEWRATRSSRPTRELLAALDDVASARRRRSRRAAAATSCRRRSSATRGSSSAPARSTSSICCCARAIWSATGRACGRASSALHAHLRRRVPGHRPAAGGDPAAARRRRSGRAPTGATSRRRPASCSSSAIPKQSIYRFRRADVGIYREVKDLLARGAPSASHLHDELPRDRRRSSALVNARVRAGDDRRTATTLQADYVPLAPHRDATRRPAVGRRAAGAASRTAAARRRRRRSRSRCPTRWRVRRLAAARERLDGDRARAARRARADRGAPRLPAVPALRQLRRRRDAAPTSRRSRRAACRTCWSAASRSTSARRSRPCARRSPRSSGPTTSCRCSRRCSGSLFAIGDEELLEYRQRAAAGSIPFRAADGRRLPRAPRRRSSTRSTLLARAPPRPRNRRPSPRR